MAMEVRQSKALGEIERIDLPVHFFCPSDQIWPELRAPGRPSIDEARLAELSISPTDCWILRTCYELRDRSDDVSVGPELRLDRINIASVYDLGRKNRLNRCFVVTTQADGFRSALGNFNLRQNGLEPSDETQGWVPHWLQPGLRPRDPARGDVLRNAAYRGYAVNLIASLHAPAFAEALAERGILFDNGLRGDGPPVPWEDYSDVDVLIALRNVTERDLLNKPASKLVNAWAAGVPAILGPEPAYRELKRSPLDYIEAASVAEVVAALDSLKRDPGLYRAMSQNGLERAKDFTPQRIADRWVALLNGPIARAFMAWNGRGGIGKAIAVGGMLLDEPRRRREYLAYRDHGKRPLGNARTGGDALTWVERRLHLLAANGMSVTQGRGRAGAKGLA